MFAMQYTERLACLESSMSVNGCLATVNGCTVGRASPAAGVKLMQEAVWNQHSQQSPLLSNQTATAVANVTAANSARTTANLVDNTKHLQENSKMQGHQTGPGDTCADNKRQEIMPQPCANVSTATASLPTTGEDFSARNVIATTSDAQQSPSNSSDASLSKQKDGDLIAAAVTGGLVNAVNVQTTNAVRSPSIVTVSSVDVCPAERSSSAVTASVSERAITSPSENSVCFTGTLSQSVTSTITSCSTVAQSSQCAVSVISDSLSSPQPTSVASAVGKLPAVHASGVKTITLYTVTSSPSHKNPALTSSNAVNSPVSPTFSRSYTSPLTVSSVVTATTSVTSSTAASHVTSTTQMSPTVTCNTNEIAVASAVEGKSVVQPGKQAEFATQSHDATIRPKSLNESLMGRVDDCVLVASTATGGAGSSGVLSDRKLDKLNCDEDRLSTGSFELNQAHACRSDRHSVSSISSETRSCAGPLQHCDIPLFMVADRGVSMGQGIEKLLDRTASASSRRSGGYEIGKGVVRSSWSQENYFDHSDLACVDIELDDEDDLASSVDVLHYRDGSTSSHVSLSGQLPSHSWTEDDIDDNDTAADLAAGKLRSWAPLTNDAFSQLAALSGENAESKNVPSTSSVSDYKRKATAGVGIAMAVDADEVARGFPTNTDSRGNDAANKSETVPPTQTDTVITTSETDGDSVMISCEPFALATRPMGKDVDRPSAARLAKRLFYLHGFRKADVLRHLTKK